MPPQHVEVAETIAALKRALRREKEGPTDQPISAATNRGNKLKSGASYVHAGALPYDHRPDGYKQACSLHHLAYFKLCLLTSEQKIEHAGYSRFILERNPRRFNGFGDELGDSESDTEADEDAQVENPYSNVRIEELLRPIQHPSELATHPTLSLPFLDPALPAMLRSTEDKLRQERASLWRAKNLNRHFIGDESWVPLGAIEGTNDWDLFEPRSRPVPEQANKKRKISANNQSSRNGINGHDHSSLQVAHPPSNQAPEASNEATENSKSSTTQEDPFSEDQQQISDVLSSEHHPPVNGVHKDHKTDKDMEDEKDRDMTTPEPTNHTTDPTTQSNEQQDEVREGSVQRNTPPPTRRITRALAAEQDGSALASVSGSSPESTTSSLDPSLLQPDPFFLPPPSFAASHRNLVHLARVGLPVDEFLETRRLLTTYIQKQEESVRGYEAFLGKLIRAKRMRDKVWEWSKAEGHVGEWSDGEDWIDSEAWGLAPDELKKGKDEEEVDGQEDTGRKVKRRRRD